MQINRQKHSVQAKRISTRRLVIDALFAALFTVVSMLSIPLPAGVGKLSFASLPIIFCAYLMGPADALMVALIGKFLEQLRYGLSFATVLFILPFVVLALFLGLAFYKTARAEDPTGKQHNLVLLITVCVGEILLTTLNTAMLIAANALFPESRFLSSELSLLYFALRYLNCAIRIIPTCIVVYHLLPRIKRLVNFP